MTPESLRIEARRFRKIAAEQPASAASLLAQADNRERAAALLIEINKINAALARPFRVQSVDARGLH